MPLKSMRLAQLCSTLLWASAAPALAQAPASFRFRERAGGVAEARDPFLEQQEGRRELQRLSLELCDDLLQTRELVLYAHAAPPGIPRIERVSASTSRPRHGNPAKQANFTVQ